ncbi:MAG: hypothetical protein LUD48_05715, partial [Prevotella sp.]|nr:hypothetical protein [Prevotella sp.]
YYLFFISVKIDWTHGQAPAWEEIISPGMPTKQYPKLFMTQIFVFFSYYFDFITITLITP